MVTHLLLPCTTPYIQMPGRTVACSLDDAASTNNEEHGFMQDKPTCPHQKELPCRRRFCFVKPSSVCSTLSLLRGLFWSHAAHEPAGPEVRPVLLAIASATRIAIDLAWTTLPWVVSHLPVIGQPSSNG